MTLTAFFEQQQDRVRRRGAAESAIEQERFKRATADPDANPGPTARQLELRYYSKFADPIRYEIGNGFRSFGWWQQ